MKKRTLVWLVLALVIFGGGAWVAQKQIYLEKYFLVREQSSWHI